MQKTDFFINAVKMVEIDGGINVPTAVLYPTAGEPLIGAAALASGQERHDIHVDFKVELGSIEPGSSLPKDTHNPVRLTTDFLHQLLKYTKEWLTLNDIDPTHSTSILLAEPLSMQTAMETALAPPAWLSNYRNNLKRMLEGRGFTQVDFLPEPFAVFQYYRHGFRHPTVAEGGKKRVLVIDVGGGTCDVCVIETTKDGDISQTGRNSRPIAACSTPVAGFFINRIIAIELFRKLGTQGNLKDRISKGIGLYQTWRKQRKGLSGLPPDYVTFVRLLDAFVYEVEDLKLALCKSITDWTLDAAVTTAAPITMPSDPFSQRSARSTLMLSAVELRDIFIKQIWTPYLKPTIALALTRAREELQGAPISVILLSGGTANIGWLRHLLLRDFSDVLEGADILRLPDFQEVVAKGLAVECARRFHTPGGDFKSQTYNRLCLILESDQSGPQLKRFVPRSQGIPNSDVPGVLLPSASALGSVIGKQVRWRVRLDRPPHHRLDYYFLRSSFDLHDIDNLQNFEERTVFTPPGTTFDANLTIELTIAEDGTASPRFIYRSSPQDGDARVASGRPFYLDMTYGKALPEAKAYLGLDFGTSNTAISYVDQRSVEIYRRRSSESSWNNLNDLVSILPYPIAAPLSQYMGQVDPARVTASASEVLEGALALSAYVAFLEYCTIARNAPSRLFRGFTQRSAGPLWKLLKDCLDKMRGDAKISAPYLELLTPELRQPLDDAVTAFAQHKHGKSGENTFDPLRPVQIITNINYKVFSENIFGFFQQITKQRFSSEYRGLFRHAHGRSPFTDASTYHGVASFADGEAFLLNQSLTTLLPLQPLIFWDNCSRHADLDSGHCYLFDKETRDGQFSYKAVGFSCSPVATLDNEYSALASILAAWKESDPELITHDVGDFEDGTER